MASIQAYGEKWRVQIEIAGVRDSSVFKEEYEAKAWAKARTEELQFLKKMRVNARRSLKNTQAFSEATRSYSAEEIISKSTPYQPTCGVYFLMHKDTIVYVGQSVNVYRRTDGHLKAKLFDRITVIECPKEDLDRVERLYIEKFKPALNKLGKSGNNEFIKITEYVM